MARPVSRRNARSFGLPPDKTTGRAAVDGTQEVTSGPPGLQTLNSNGINCDALLTVDNSIAAHTSVGSVVLYGGVDKGALRSTNGDDAVIGQSGRDNVRAGKGDGIMIDGRGGTKRMGDNRLLSGKEEDWLIGAMTAKPLFSSSTTLQPTISSE